MSGSLPSGLSRAAQRAAQGAAARSAAYACFARALAYPEGEPLEAIRSGALARELEEVLAALSPRLASQLDRAGLRDAPGDDTLALEYTRLFESGAGGPPCPLHGGLYGGARMQVMEESVRFYRYFGLRLRETPAELPDHLATQLELMHYLAFREARALECGDDPGAFRRAQRDFVERHPGRWVPALCARLEREEPQRFFSALFGALARFLADDQRGLRHAAGAAPVESQRPAS